MKNIENYNALLITQYERFGTVGMNEYIENYIHEQLIPSIDISFLSSFNEYLLEQKRGDDYLSSFDMFEKMLSGLDPSEAFRLAYSSKDFSFNDDFWKFDGYGNLESYTETEVIRMIQEDNDFLKWYIEENELIDEEEAEEDIKEANRLIKLGY